MTDLILDTCDEDTLEPTISDIFSRPALMLTDDRHIDKELKKTLSTLQYRVDVSITESEALQLIKSQKFFLIIVEENPSRQINSMSFYKKLIKQNPEYKHLVIFISENPFSVFAEEVKLLGCHNMPKIFSPSALAITIESMREKALLEENRKANRYNWSSPCALQNKKSGFVGKTMDISALGFKIYYRGDDIPVGSVIEMSVPAIEFQGLVTVAWTFKVGDKNMLGLALEDKLPITKLQLAVPFACEP